jgi:uncharacterized protein HemX
MPPRHPSNPEIPADQLAAEHQAAKGRREVVAAVLSVLVVIAIAVGGWAHLRLWTDNDRLTRLETQREIEKQALEQRLNTMEQNLSRQINDLRDALLLARGKG